VPILHHNGADLFYAVAGSGPALIFAHGLGGNHLSWWQQVPAFSARYTCVTFAHRGFAPSTDAPDGPGPRAFADDLAALLDHLGLGDVRLVAQSMGGWTCLDYAVRHPDRVRGLVLACTVGSLATPEIDRLFAGGAGGESDLAARGIHPACGERMAREQPALHHLYRQIDGLSFALDKGRARAELMRLRATPAEALTALRFPVLCLSGAEDIVIPTAAVERAATLFPHGRFVRVPEAGHSVYFERPAQFNAIIEQFLSDLPA
jgi:pimeloyl-ACP methyl ester carboxylesterase